MYSLEFDHGIRIHALQSGTVAVKRAHRNYKGIAALRFPQILLSPFWTDDLPVWMWLLESPEGNFVVDTGENTHVNDADYFGADTANKFIHRRILKLKVREEDQLDFHLAKVGLSPKDIDAVVLTHLHIDHTDGLKFLPGVEVLLGAREWENQWGATPSTWPKGFSPRLLTYNKAEHPFGHGYQLTRHISVVPTPGHSHGHQSVLVHGEQEDILIAGDTSFTQAQLLQGGIPGISADFSKARATRNCILDFGAQRPLVYLPSHDPESSRRLLELSPMLV